MTVEVYEPGQILENIFFDSKTFAVAQDFSNKDEFYNISLFLFASIPFIVFSIHIR